MYIQFFPLSLLVRLHHIFLIINQQSGTHLNPVPMEAKDFDLSFCGAMIQSDVAAKIANGEIDPMTHEPFPAVLAIKKVEKDVIPIFASNLKRKSTSNVFLRRSETKKKRNSLGNMEKYIRRSSKESAFQKPRSIVPTATTTTTTLIREQKEQVCPNTQATLRSKYFSTSSSDSTSRNALLQSLKRQNNQSNNKVVGSTTQQILNRFASTTMQSNSIGERFDPISTRSSLNRFDLSSTTSSDSATKKSTTISEEDSLSRFQMTKQDEEEVTSSQRDDFQMAATLIRSPDRIVKATVVNLLDDTSFDSLESPAQVIPETPPRSVKKSKKIENLKKSFAFRLSKFTFQKS